jgi:hypothetical protein
VPAPAGTASSIAARAITACTSDFSARVVERILGPRFEWFWTPEEHDDVARASPARVSVTSGMSPAACTVADMSGACRRHVRRLDMEASDCARDFEGSFARR